MELIYPMAPILIPLWWLVLALGVGAVAQELGDSFGRRFLVALFASPPMALLYLIASRQKPAQ